MNYKLSCQHHDLHDAWCLGCVNEFFVKQEENNKSIIKVLVEAHEDEERIRDQKVEDYVKQLYDEIERLVELRNNQQEQIRMYKDEVAHLKEEIVHLNRDIAKLDTEQSDRFYLMPETKL